LNELLKRGSRSHKLSTPANENGIDVYQLVTEHDAFFIMGSDYADEYLMTIKAPQCKDLFMTIIDGTYTSYSFLLPTKMLIVCI
jgi:hypothetical protein